MIIDHTSPYVILIPAYNPNHQLVQLIKDLNELNLNNILIVNDGSDEEHQPIFKQLDDYQCHVLNHDTNQGKGAALKTGIEYSLKESTELKRIITADGDGQHLPKDIVRVLEESQNQADDLVLGKRSFTKEDAPFRSRVGNFMMRYAIKFETGIKLDDTHTGLRAIPIRYAEEIVDIPGDHYEFEMNMITNANKFDIDIHEVPIKTVYLEDSSHFRPIVDTIRIYFVFFKYVLSSVASYIIDMLLYTLFVFIFDPFFQTKHVIVATILARVLSALFNYTVNRKIVFKSDSKRSLLKYAILSIAILATSATGVYLIYSIIGHGEVIIKMGVDASLFIVSYLVQKLFIFKGKVNESI
ncbi:bifunctional glycosyltransferase family 2/GtrA family protein [Tenuibacillus multivorans]|uniref:Glycosyltransferase involved in cell wall bisynthesis n=1 Tax=Tenuibacillus multivorans TaxID=237069 RepID=A0A1G9WE42_9BACI|nr:bifunctional glycosyltransferase family 2/GtrA family protein [Tenuibacillus multivorans]GEL76410.1 dolichyl-phosphate mannose synthase [Tenuibacillus multivorans]SDM82446.1 Glycosyltransferase involved in cell wall bisynthesis [Tenuibacillus multivorans]